MFIYLYLAVWGLCCFMGYPLVAMSGGYSPVAVHELLVVVASLIVEHRLEGPWAQWLWPRGLVARGTWDPPGSGIETLG